MARAPCVFSLNGKVVTFLLFCVIMWKKKSYLKEEVSGMIFFLLNIGSQAVIYVVGCMPVKSIINLVLYMNLRRLNFLSNSRPMLYTRT